jgi:gamma-glutamylcyclotransferase (GGCT)/AIG2-like uncharacterized protein YtfP
MVDIFTYGSLMFGAVWRQVVSGRYRRVPARLKGWRRLSIRDRDYPAAIPGRGAIEGILWRRVRPSDVERLDRFEGDEYIRVPCTVEVPGPQDRVGAHVYQFRSAGASRLTERPWDPARFERIALRRFLSRFSGFQRMDARSPRGRHRNGGRLMTGAAGPGGPRCTPAGRRSRGPFHRRINGRRGARNKALRSRGGPL